MVLGALPAALAAVLMVAEAAQQGRGHQPVGTALLYDAQQAQVSSRLHRTGSRIRQPVKPANSCLVQHPQLSWPHDQTL